MRFTEAARTLRNENQPCARLVNIVGDHDIHRTWLVAVEPVGEFGFDDGAFRQPVQAAVRRDRSPKAGVCVAGLVRLPALLSPIPRRRLERRRYSLQMLVLDSRHWA